MLDSGTVSRKSVQAGTGTVVMTSMDHFLQIRDAKSPIETASRSPVIDKANECPLGHRRLPSAERTTQSAASDRGVSQPPTSDALSMRRSNAASQIWNRSGWIWRTRWEPVEDAISIIASKACQRPAVLCIPRASTRISSSGSETGISTNVGYAVEAGEIGASPY